MINNMYVLSTQARENQCSDTIKLPFDAFESSTNAIRSNNVVSALLGALTSSVPFIVLYFVPIIEVLRKRFRYRIEGIISDGIVFWFLGFVNLIAKNIWKQPRPEAYRLCIRNKLAYGQPSGHAMWSVGIWTFCFVMFMSKRPLKPKNEQIAKPSVQSWVYDSIFNVFENKYLKNIWIITLSILWLFNIPFVRYDLQYHTILQIVSGMGLGAIIGAGWSIILEKYPKLSYSAWLRLFFCVSWAVLKYVYSQSAIIIVPLAFEIPIFLYQAYSKHSPEFEGYELATRAENGVKLEEEEEWSESDEKAWQDAILEKPAQIFF